MTNQNKYVAPATFKEWLTRHLDKDDLRCLCEYGAAATTLPGLIYYEETYAIYQAYEDEIEAIAQEYGGIGRIALHTDAYGITQLINALVWTAAEHYARLLTVSSQKGARHD